MATTTTSQQIIKLWISTPFGITTCQLIANRCHSWLHHEADPSAKFSANPSTSASKRMNSSVAHIGPNHAQPTTSIEATTLLFHYLSGSLVLYFVICCNGDWPPCCCSVYSSKYSVVLSSNRRFNVSSQHILKTDHQKSTNIDAFTNLPERATVWSPKSRRLRHEGPMRSDFSASPILTS